MRRGLAGSREGARTLVASGAVLVGGAPADKASRLVAASEAVVVLAGDDTARFVSRGGAKLDAALTRFGVAVAGRRCLDAGASTGGFTDCLLRRGAAQVVAVDVGYGQLDPSLRHDRRVRVLERTDVRALDPAAVGGPFPVVVADLSFISLATVAPVLAGTLALPDAELVVLVKPQFEAGRRHAARGRGVIRDPAVRREALERAASALVSQGAAIMGAMASPLLGPAGNAEFLVRARAHAAPVAPGGTGVTPGSLEAGVLAMLDAAVGEAPDAPPAGAQAAPRAPGPGDD